MPAHALGDLVIDSAPMANREDSDRSLASVDGIDEPIPSHPELPQPLEVSTERRAGGGIDGDGAKGGLDPALDLWREVANDLGHVRREVDPPDRHYRGRRLGVTSGSPNTSSNDRPRRRVA